ncbi:hypothetical protein AOLI_G00197100 [Acnodon oligacanthus]
MVLLSGSQLVLRLNPHLASIIKGQRGSSTLELEVDASDAGVGAVLLQDEVMGTEHPDGSSMATGRPVSFTTWADVAKTQAE